MTSSQTVPVAAVCHGRGRTSQRFAGCLFPASGPLDASESYERERELSPTNKYTILTALI